MLTTNLTPFTSEQTPLKFPYRILIVFVTIVFLFIAFLCFHHQKQEASKTLKVSTLVQQTSRHQKINIKIKPNKAFTKPLQPKSTIKLAPDTIIINEAQTAKLRQLLSTDSGVHYPTLPLPHSLHTAKQQIVSTPTIIAQRCIYNNQNYVPGDIVKVDQGWMRCTPTILFTPENPTKQQTGNPTWTKVQ